MSTAGFVIPVNQAPSRFRIGGFPEIEDERRPGTVASFLPMPTDAVAGEVRQFRALQQEACTIRGLAGQAATVGSIDSLCPGLLQPLNFELAENATQGLGGFTVTIGALPSGVFIDPRLAGGLPTTRTADGVLHCQALFGMGVERVDAGGT